MNWARNRKNRVVLFFDGSPDSNFPREKASFGNVEVRLAFPASADAAILKETKLDPRNRTIVTGDRALADKIKSLKGKIVPVRDFIKRLSP